MTIIERYIGKTIVSATLLVLLIFTGLVIFIAIVREVSDFGNGTYGFIGALEYVLLDLPKQIYQLFPLASLIGVVLGLGILANHSELTILRANGLSLNQITWMVAKTLIVMLAIATIIGEYLAPISQHLADNRKALLISNGQTLTTTRGTWMRDGEDFLYIHAVLGNRQLEGVSRYQFDKNAQLIRASFAKSGHYEKHRWIMRDVVNSEINTKHIQTSQTPTAEWKLAINPNLLHIATVNANQMSLKELFFYIRYLKNNNLNAADYALAFWQRIFQPLATLVMMWLAISFVFGSVRSVTMGLRLMTGIVVGFVFYILNQFFGPLSVVYQWPPFIAALLPTILFAAAAYFLMQRIA